MGRLSWNIRVAQCNHRALVRKRKEGQSQRQGHVMLEEDRNCEVIQDKYPRNVSNLWKLEIAKDGLSFSFSRRAALPTPLILGQ